MHRSQRSLLALLLVRLSACSEDHATTPADGGGETLDAGQPDASTPTPYTLCDGSAAVRFAAVSQESGLSTGRHFEVTNPYGFTFLYITGTCEYLVGEHRVGAIRSGTIEPAQADALATELELARLSTLHHDGDENCDDGGTYTVRTQLGYGTCACGCDDDAPPGLDAIMRASHTTYDALFSAGEALSGDVEVGGLVRQPDPRVTFHPWPLTLDLATVAITQEAFDAAHAFPLTRLTGDNAAAARTLHAAEAARGDRTARHVRQADGFYKLYILDVIPARWHAAVTAFEPKPR